jgi:hypothetical protein
MAWRNIDTDLALPADAATHGDDVADGYEPPVRRGAEPRPARAYGSGALAGPKDHESRSVTPEADRHGSSGSPAWPHSRL